MNNGYIHSLTAPSPHHHRTFSEEQMLETMEKAMDAQLNPAAADFYKLVPMEGELILTNLRVSYDYSMINLDSP